MNDLREWQIAKQLSDDFISNIKFVYIYLRGKSLICVTHNDNVYSYGSGMGYLGLGLGHNTHVSQPSLVKELCQKQVKDIKIGDRMLLALTHAGEVYSWGLNNYGQLGHQIAGEYNCLKPAVINALVGKQVIDISCCKYYCLALTQNGVVYEWGRNIFGIEIVAPTQVNGMLFETITDISTGSAHCLALTENGDVFSWGDNSKGQLGIASTIDQCIAIKIENLDGNKVVKIACGPDYSLLLTESGLIYAFGSNDSAQLGDNDGWGLQNRNIPMRIDVSAKFVDIVAPGFYIHKIAIGLAEDGFCYSWGDCNDQIITKPARTQFKNIDEAMLYYSKLHNATYKTYHFEKRVENMSPMERIEQTFNNREYRNNDLKFKIEGKYIYVQKSYLINVCQHFDTLFSNEWLESTNNEIEITQYSYPVYYALLRYLYTNRVNIKSKHLIELYYLADSYFEANLKLKCIEMMKYFINVNNVFTYYFFAINNKFNELENTFYDFIIINIKDIVKSESFYQIKDSSVFHKFIKSAVVCGHLSAL
jgi:alpha-tubulin suppressor-like RCC1 family protein